MSGAPAPLDSGPVQPRLSLVPDLPPDPWWHPSTPSGRWLQLAVRSTLAFTAGFALLLALAYAVAWASTLLIPLEY